jgi:glycine C-acetyltransferase
LYAAAFDANGGVFEPLLRRRCIISDELNHASIIDGVRLLAARYDTKIIIWKIWKLN